MKDSDNGLTQEEAEYEAAIEANYEAEQEAKYEDAIAARYEAEEQAKDDYERAVDAAIEASYAAQELAEAEEAAQEKDNNIGNDPRRYQKPDEVWDNYFNHQNNVERENISEESDQETNTEIKSSVAIPESISISNAAPSFNVGTISNTLASIIKNIPDKSGMMIGVFGKWGRGKTYLVDKVWENLDQNTSYKRVNFSAWKYQDTKES